MLGPKGQQCFTQLSEKEVLESRANCLQLSKDELDLVVLAHLHCHLRKRNTESRKRKRNVCCFFISGQQVCRATYLFLHGIGKDRYNSLSAHYSSHGLTTRTHGNKGRLPKNACSYEAVHHVSTFTENYAEQHALVLPGRVPGFKRTDVRLLPSNMSKASVWRSYRTALKDKADIKPVGYSKFVDLWNQLTPHVLIMRPMSDLCFTCQHNNTQIIRSANLPQNTKTALVKSNNRTGLLQIITERC